MVKFLLYKLIPAILLLLFVAMMNSGTFLKNPIGLSDNVPEYFAGLKDGISGNQWAKASDDLKNLQIAWQKVLQRIQFSVERDEINNFQHSLARLKGYLEARDRSGSYAELEELKETWNDLAQ